MYVQKTNTKQKNKTNTVELFGKNISSCSTKQSRDANNMHRQISITNVFIELQKPFRTVYKYSNTSDHVDFPLMMVKSEKQKKA